MNLVTVQTELIAYWLELPSAGNQNLNLLAEVSEINPDYQDNDHVIVAIADDGRHSDERYVPFVRRLHWPADDERFRWWLFPISH